MGYPELIILGALAIPIIIIIVVMNKIFAKNDNSGEEDYFTSVDSNKVKEEVGDFFKIDIHRILQNPDVKETEEKNRYELRLKEYELGIFYKVEIIKFDDNVANMHFTGVRGKDKATPELVELVNFYANKNGFDENGLGKADLSEYPLCRMWKDFLLMSIEHTFNLTICDIKMTEPINNK